MLHFNILIFFRDGSLSRLGESSDSFGLNSLCQIYKNDNSFQNSYYELTFNKCRARIADSMLA